jgi:hypothetical protein
MAPKGKWATKKRRQFAQLFISICLFILAYSTQAASSGQIRYGHKIFNNVQHVELTFCLFY